jgi:polypeptide N-acetylgalactosaminyltransferase
MADKTLISNELKISYFKSKHSSELKDWNDYAAIERDKIRQGPGEQGTAVELTNEELGENATTFDKFKKICDKIAQDRSIPDSRPVGCLNKTYLADLPSVSIIITFYNEYHKVLTRTIHSIINRTPKELLKEIIMINDGSDNEDCHEPFENYVENNFDSKIVRIIKMPVRSGLIQAR